MLLDETTLRKLHRLTLIARRIRSGAIKGERRSSKRGSSIEFADYRDYTPGDDLRRLDWNIYARLERPFIKLLEEEEDLAVHLLLDASKSMDWPPEAENTLHKFRYALRLAAGLGAVALASGDSLTVGILQNGRVTAEFGPTRGQIALPRLFAFLENLQPDGETRLREALQAYALTPRRPGLFILISDLFETTPDHFLRLLRRQQEAVLLHVLSPDELDPPLTGDLQLLDIETGQTQDVSLDGGLRSLYRKRAAAWLESLQAECRKQGMRYLSVVTNRPWDEMLLLEMRKANVVK
ncbi:MAG: DUF58 domain-containing protein [Anaerolineales bacterium]|nr:DUF58 domain-containing protein [Anaerolineales bacterium]MCX7754766.1 DUF58 domain-containing protein [Anaerolineales bacterium]